jgi:hypothetical protein
MPAQHFYRLCMDCNSPVEWVPGAGLITVSGLTVPFNASLE